MRKKLKLPWYHPDLVGRARELRKNSTKAEAMLWEKLKGKQVKGCSFRRQRPIGHYIVDFYCPEFNLVIELDGSIHNRIDIKRRDQLRQDELEELGLTVLRFCNEEVFRSPDAVLDQIKQWMESGSN